MATVSKWRVMTRIYYLANEDEDMDIAICEMGPYPYERAMYLAANAIGAEHEWEPRLHTQDVWLEPA